MGVRLTTKVQVSGWRFLLRRLEHALVRRDTRMFDDPLQFYGRSMSLGVVIALLILLGAGALALFKPQGKFGGGDLFADGTTYEVYLNLQGRLHPVFNLTSARLVLRSAADPQVVKSSELESLPRGQWVGIPGAPYSTPVSGTSTSWAMCDTVTNPTSVSPALQTTLITMPLAMDISVDPLTPAEAVLTNYQGQDWLVTTAGRHAVDRSNRALTASVGIPPDAVALPISEGIFNALPDAGAWNLPPVPEAGAPNDVGLPDEFVIGSVFQMYAPTGTQFYVVLPGAVAPVNATTAAALRATQSYGLAVPPTLEPSIVVPLPDAVYPSPLPDNPVTLVIRRDETTLCWTWERRPGEQAPKTSVATGRRLPIPPAMLTAGITQIQGSATVYTDGGKYVAVQSLDPRYGEALYYVDAQGVRYGIPDAQTAGYLGLSAPATAPWEVLRLLVEGPVLSQENALLEHDTVATMPTPRKIDGGAG
ncbi:type VII secretion protein EccB [Mycolicibacterium sp. S2-37]|uniref:type VII secretion protein EccB n=1 Tax=Mycolicibacterium sp. S2-37 TaxID=2810297 RepID=UPI001A94F9BD|nr:type VII secretion protein EccB [Mycolicibacterium sp. S2-37]MBO0677345.1 type VII secretion protein EccB [Mycolicibacterium sp. S2-37]